MPKKPTGQSKSERVRFLLSDEWVSDTGDEGADKRSMTVFNEVLSQMDSRELHEFASGFNWDGGFDEMRSVIMHPKCDAGTGLLVYWRASPAFYYKYKLDDLSEHERETFGFVQQIEKMYLNSQFSTSEISFSPTSFRGVDLTRGNIRGRRRIPAEMFGESSDD